MVELQGHGTAQTTVSSANLATSPGKKFINKQDADRIGLLNKANNGGRP